MLRDQDKLRVRERTERLETALRNLLDANVQNRRVMRQVLGSAGSTNLQIEAEHEAREALKP
jgi:hypothetical protein